MVSERNVVSLVENNLSYAQRLELRSKLGQVRTNLYRTRQSLWESLTYNFRKKIRP